MNDDMISRKWLMECVDEGWIEFDTEKDKNTYVHLVRDIAPPAQPDMQQFCNQLATVRCEDCTYQSGGYCHHAKTYGLYVGGNHFCGYAERRGDAEAV